MGVIDQGGGGLFIQPPTGAGSFNSFSTASTLGPQHNAVIVEAIPSGGAVSYSYTVLDSPDDGGYKAAVDPNGTTGTLTAYDKRLVANVLPFIKISAVITAGQVAFRITPIAAVGTQSKGVSVFSATGTGTIALSTTMSKAFRLVSVTCHFSAAPTTSESITATLNALDGAAYDTVLLKTNPSQGALTDIVYMPDGHGLIFEAGDQIDVAFTNTDARTYGCRIVCQEV